MSIIICRDCQLITTDHIKELTNIEYDRVELERFYNSIKHKAIAYTERHTDYISAGAEHSPFFRCTCSACFPSGKHHHAENQHYFIRHLERFHNPEVNRLSDLLADITKTSTPNFPVMWIYQPGFQLPPHKDFARTCSVIVPILPAEGGSTVNLYSDSLPVIEEDGYNTVVDNDDYLIGVHTYSTKHPTVLNAGNVVHSVHNSNTVRVFINFSGYCDWQSIV